MVTTILYLAFHDCVSTKCDGCLNMDNPDNAGLQRAIDSLEVARTTYIDEGISMTRADLWALAGKKPHQIISHPFMYLSLLWLEGLVKPPSD